MNESKQRKAGAILSYVNLGVSLLFSVIYTPFMLRLLGPEQHGLYKAVASITNYLSLFSLGFGSSYLRFFSRCRSEEDRKELSRLNALFIIVFGTAAVLALITGGILSLIPEVIFGSEYTSENLITSSQLTILMTIQISVSFLSSVFSMYIGAKERFVFLRLLTILTTVGVPVATLFLLLKGWGSIGLVAAGLCFGIIEMIANFIFARKNGFSCSFHGLRWSLFREISVFSLWIFIHSLLSVVHSSIDTLIITRTSGPSGVSVYSIGNEFLSYLLSFVIVISDVFRPKVYFMISDQRPMSEITDKVIQIGRIQYYILSLAVGGFAVFGRYFVVLYAGEAYRDSYWVALLMMLACLTGYIQNICLEIIKAMNKHVFRAILLCIASLVNIAISIPLTLSFGVIGAAIGSAIVLILSTAVTMNIYYYKEIGIDIPRFWRSLFKPILVSLVPCVLFFAVSIFVPIDSVVKFLIGALCYCLIFVILQWIFSFNPQEKDQVRSLLSFLKKRLPSDHDRIELR